MIEVIGTHSYLLDTPPGIHNVFHSQYSDSRRLTRYEAKSKPMLGRDPRSYRVMI
jgi:hypothetical protein